MIARQVVEYYITFTTDMLELSIIFLVYTVTLYTGGMSFSIGDLIYSLYMKHIGSQIYARLKQHR